jgi:hypothetical protein|tara:strand:- start:9356 stop:9493 length:138 start_codon:yes stop_codon:yes gene_type:complete
VLDAAIEVASQEKKVNEVMVVEASFVGKRYADFVLIILITLTTKT